MAKVTYTQIPVLLGYDYQHVMGHADIYEEGYEITIMIRAGGENARDLAELFQSGEPQAISFVSIPVMPHTHKENT